MLIYVEESKAAWAVSSLLKSTTADIRGSTAAGAVSSPLRSSKADIHQNHGQFGFCVCLFVQANITNEIIIAQHARYALRNLNLKT